MQTSALCSFRSFLTLKGALYLYQSPSPSTTHALSATNLLPVSMDLPMLNIMYKCDMQHVAFVPGFFHLAQ